MSATAPLCQMAVSLMYGGSVSCMTQDFMHAFMALDALPFKEGATREMVGFFSRAHSVVPFVLFVTLMRFRRSRLL